MSKNHMHLGLFIRPCGHHIASWRHPECHTDAGVNFQHFVEMAQTAERGMFDLLFSADSQTAWTGAEAHIDKVHYTAWLEPYTLLSALSAHTKNIGLVCTATTSFEQPFIVARKFATLDHISGGRAGWNVVTSGNETEAANFQKEPHLPKVERYRRGREFVEVVRALWDSWDEDAFIRDKQSGTFFDRSKMHVLDHHGDYYDVRGPLNVARTPQGQPVIVQAGLSEDGRALAAETAEVVFCAHATIESAQEYYSNVKGRMAAFGRATDQMKILPGLSVITAPTEAEAQEKFRQLQELLHPDLGLALLSSRLGHDVTGFALDKPLPDLPENKVISSRSDMIKAWSREKNTNGNLPTLRELCQRFAASRGHYSIIGTPKQVVDVMEDWFRNGACDGFNFVPSVYPIGLNDFVDLVIPELQRRDLFRTAYEGSTLRGVLGIAAPTSRYAQQSRAAE